MTIFMTFPVGSAAESYAIRGPGVEGTFEENRQKEFPSAPGSLLI